MYVLKSLAYIFHIQNRKIWAIKKWRWGKNVAPWGLVLYVGLSLRPAWSGTYGVKMGNKGAHSVIFIGYRREILFSFDANGILHYFTEDSLWPYPGRRAKINTRILGFVGESHDSSPGMDFWFPGYRPFMSKLWQTFPTRLRGLKQVGSTGWATIWVVTILIP